MYELGSNNNKNNADWRNKTFRDKSSQKTF